MAVQPRTEVPLAINMFGGPEGHGVRIESGAIIVDNFKYIIGDVGPGKHFDPYYPQNDTRPAADDVGCPLPGCLFDIIADPSEYHNLAASQPADLERLADTLHKYIPSLFQSDRVAGNNGTYDCYGCLHKAREVYGKAAGQPWFGPWL
jgi:hypothetical protein